MADCNPFVADAPELRPVGMRVETHVAYALEAADGKQLDRALMHACIAVDATAKKLYPHLQSQGNVTKRYLDCLHEYCWLLETMIGAGMNLADTRFPNVGTPKNPNPDFADIVYRIFRCNAAHGDEIPVEYALTKSEWNVSHWGFANGKLHMPDRVVFALLGVAVFSRANTDIRTDGEYCLTLETATPDKKVVMPIRNWWGRESDFRLMASLFNQAKLTVVGLEKLAAEGNVAHLVLKQPYVK